MNHPLKYSGRALTASEATVPAEPEIPELLRNLEMSIETLSQRQAQFHGRLAGVLTAQPPRENAAPTPFAQTAMGETLACQVARVDCLIEDLDAIDRALGL